MTDATEEHRHRCEVRQILRWRLELGRTFVHEFINGQKDNRGGIVKKGVRQQRGDAAADRLLADCAQQWSLGNDGADGKWLEPEAAAEEPAIAS